MSCDECRPIRSAISKRTVTEIQTDVEALTLLFFKSPERERETERQTQTQQLAYHLKYFMRSMWSKKEGQYNHEDPLL
jgi:hypothetical protein